MAMNGSIMNKDLRSIPAVVILLHVIGPLGNDSGAMA